MAQQRLRRLSQHEYFKLCRWLEESVPHMEPGTTYASIASKASDAMEIDIADSSVTDAMKNLGIPLPKRKELTLEDRVKILAKYVEILWNDAHPTLALPKDLEDSL